MKNKRKDKIIDLTALYKRGKNKLEILPDTNPEPTSYIWGVFIVKQFEWDDIISFINSMWIFSIKQSIDLIKHKLTSNNGIDISDEDIIVERKVDFTLVWPISYTRIKTPVRGSFCEHVQWFDLDNFIKINQNWRNFKCPVWNKKALNIFKDEFQTWLLTQKLSETSTRRE